jgi:hypothetical protein
MAGCVRDDARRHRSVSRGTLVHPPPRRRLRLLSLSALVAALSVAALTTVAPANGKIAARAAKTKTKTITCNLTLFAIVPQPAPTAANFGTTTCTKPFGLGVQQDSSVTTRTSPTTGFFTGPFKMFFNDGTIKGTFRIAFKTTLNAAYKIVAVNYTGTLKVRFGTGKFKKVKGSGTLTGISPDLVKSALRYKLRLSGL